MKAWRIVLPEFLLVGVGAALVLAWLPPPALAGIHAGAVLAGAGYLCFHRRRKP